MSVAAPDLTALRLLGDRVRPLRAAAERTIAGPEALREVLPHGGLQRGSTVATSGPAAASMALALAGPATRSGAWIAVIGLTHLGLVAGAELGVDLERVLLVADPEPRAWGATVAALLDAVDLVLIRPTRPVTPTVQRRLQARARERGSVLLQVGGATGVWAQTPDLVLRGSDPTWVGLGRGHGRLEARQLTLSVSGRRGADQSRRARVWLPAPDGGLARVESAEVAARPAPDPLAISPWRDAG